MDIEIFKHIDGKRLDITCSDTSIKDTIQILLDELYIDGYITTVRYKTSLNDFMEYDYEPACCGDVSIKVKLEFESHLMRDYYISEFNKRIDRIKTLELCLANSIDEV